MELAAMLPGLIGAGGSLAGLLGGSPSSNVQPGQNPLQFAGNIFGPSMNMGLQQVSSSPNYYGNNGQQASDITQGLVNNPGANQMIQGANSAAGMGQGAANNTFGLGQYLAQIGQSLSPYAGQILNQGFDPQNALYNRTQQQNQEQTNANLASRGLNSSPFGAGVANKAASDFNIDWQNNLLQRMATAGQGAGQLLDQGGRDITGGASLMGQAPGLASSTSMLPYQAYNTIGQTGMGALGQLGQYGVAATQQPQQQLQDFYQLLGLGNSGSNVMNNQFNSQLTQANQGFQQNQIMGQNLGNSLSSLGKSMSGGNPFAIGSAGGSGNGSAYPSASFLSSGMGWG